MFILYSFFGLSLKTAVVIAAILCFLSGLLLFTSALVLIMSGNLISPSLTKNMVIVIAVIMGLVATCEMFSAFCLYRSLFSHNPNEVIPWLCGTFFSIACKAKNRILTPMILPEMIDFVFMVYLWYCVFSYYLIISSESLNNSTSYFSVFSPLLNKGDG